MASNVQNQIVRLHKKWGGECHYCGKKCRLGGSRKASHDKATRDHVVPKSFGGKNSLDNYVLACSECNNLRGNTLFFCSCLWCKALIDEALDDTAQLKKMFDKIVKVNKPKITSGVNHEGHRYWFVNLPGGGRSFATLEQAISFVTDTSVACSEHRNIRYERA